MQNLAIHTLRAFALILFSALSISAWSQNVGIGEVSPANKLSVKGTLSVGADYSGISAQQDGAIIEGFTGIGTAYPDRPLSISGSATGNDLMSFMDHATGTSRWGWGLKFSTGNTSGLYDLSLALRVMTLVLYFVLVLPSYI